MRVQTFGNHRFFLVPAVVAAGCVGGIVDRVSGGEQANPGDNRGASVTPALSPARIWQLSPQQYQNIVEQAFGAPVDLAPLAITERHDGFLNPAVGGLAVHELFFADLEDSVARLAAEHAVRLASRLGCALSELDRACLGKFTSTLGRVLFRTPKVDVAPFLDLYGTLAPKLGNEHAFESVLTAMMLSPKALFRVELGDQRTSARGPVRLTSEELAESLALTLLNRAPDEELLRLAAGGQLDDPTIYGQQVDRLLGSSLGSAGLQQMLAEWLGVATFGGVDKNPALFPMFNDDLKRSMVSEIGLFVDHVLTVRRGSLRDLLTLQESFVDRRLAPIYGLATQSAQTGQPVPLPAGQRAGAFTLPAALAAMSESSLTGIIYRGKVLLEKLLCVVVRPPDMDVEFPDPDSLGLPRDATTRQRMESVEKQAACAACHVLLHPMSFAMETYDPIGRYRATENGRPIDPSGSLSFTRTANMPFRNAVQMFQVLGSSREVHECFVRQAFRYIHGREDDERDRTLLAEALGRFESDGLDMRSLYRALVLSDAFTHRERR